MRRSLLCIFSLLMLLSSPYAFAGKVYYIKRLQTKRKVYQDVKVTEVSPTAITIRHKNGIAQIEMEELSPEVQAFFGYSEVKATDHKTTLKINKERGQQQYEAWQQQELDAIEERKAQLTKIKSTIDSLKNQFTQQPTIQKDIDLRPKLQELDLYASKNQGMRPSCAAFAVLTAVEYESAIKTHAVNRYSEEYLLWATIKNRSLGKTLASWSVKENPRFAYADAGFTLNEVFEALSEYGVLLKDELSYSWGSNYSNLKEPTSEQIETAKNRFTISPQRIPAVSREQLVDNIIHVLNQGIPVVIGANFPRSKELTWTHILKDQKPFSGHAVTLVGYKSPKGKREGTQFIFKNSWGPRWGIVGYGFIDYNYLKENISEAYFLQMEVN